MAIAQQPQSYRRCFVVRCGGGECPRYSGGVHSAAGTGRWRTCRARTCPGVGFPFLFEYRTRPEKKLPSVLDFLQAQAPEASTAMDIATFIRATLRGLDNNLSLNQVDDSTPLVDAGLKPFDFYRLFEAVNTRYGLNLSMLNWQGSVSIGRLVAVIQGGASSSTVPALRDIAFTLQTCRNAHQHRVAICARDLAGFIERLQRFLGEEDPQVNGSGLYAGVKTHRFEELSKQKRWPTTAFRLLLPTTSRTPWRNCGSMAALSSGKVCTAMGCNRKMPDTRVCLCGQHP